MPAIPNATLRTAHLTAILTAIDAAATPGVLQIGTTGMASILAEFTLTDPAGSVSGDTLTLDFDPDLSDTSANNTGTAAAARIRDGDGSDVITGLTVGTSGANINLNTVSIVASGTVTLTTGTITYPTS